MGNNNKEKNMLPNDTGATFWEHLEVLRWALVRILIFMTSCMVSTFILMPHIFENYILAPTTSNFFVYQWLEQISGGLFTFPENFSVQIINIHVSSQFFTHISTSLSLAFVLSIPYIIYEIWRFIRPALYSHETHQIRFAFIGSTLMFYAGCLMAYFIVFPFCFRFLAGYELSPSIHNQIDLSSYISHFTMLILMMGLLFELPILAWLLSTLGLVNKPLLRRYKSHAVVILMVLSAIITPSGDPLTMLLVTIPLYLLYELSICLVKR